MRPVTPETWEDFTRLFEARGGPHYCWCSVYRFPDAHRLSKGEKKQEMQDLVESAVPIGVLAYESGVPVGWCSMAPRETYRKLERSRKMARVTAPQVSTWTVLCFFVARPYRGRGASRALLQGAVEYARAQGAEVIEAYPFDAAGTTATHRGHSSLFAAAGFRGDGRRWSLDLRPSGT